MPIAIVGAGRTGTSLTTRLLNLAGVDVGDDAELAAPGPMNETGFWEHPSFSSVNDQICAYFRERYGCEFAPPSGWHIDPNLDALYAMAKAIVSEFSSRSGEWAFKDPLTCFTIPFWRQVIPDLKFVVCIRNPIDAVTSSTLWYLGERSLSYANWHVSYLNVFAETEPENRVVVFYEDYFENSRATLAPVLKFAGLPEPVPGSSLGEALSSAIDDKLQHHHSTLDDVLLSDEIPYPVKRLFIDLRTGWLGDEIEHQLAQKDELMSMLVPMLKAMTVVQKFANIESKNLEYEQILNSRTHRVASGICGLFGAFRTRKVLRALNTNLSPAG